MILISAYNSADTLPGVLTGLKEYPSLDILLVDDGSTDATARIARSYGIRTIRHEQNLGKGAALQSGFQYAAEKHYAFVITHDADAQHPPESISDLLSLHEKYPRAVLLGKRTRSRNMPWPRRTSNAISAFLISRRTHRDIYDAQCGFRLIPRPYYAWKCSERKGFIFESEMLICFADNSIDLKFVPIPTLYYGNGQSRMTYFYTTFGFVSMYISSFFKNYRKINNDLP
ncbi:MAG: glycosyltransferase family 2 protein [Candidatus Marinimicrobia bacterium]|nr:glycosyltransferase family 2 protein [Candidatus Neomarinimicrobiota bacterium]